MTSPGERAEAPERAETSGQAPERTETPGQAPERLSAHQRAVAATVSLSHATIPPAFMVARVDVENALAYGRAATRRLRTLVGLPELLIKAVAAGRAEFPGCYAAGEPAGRTGVHVGVSIDVGTGLYVPVVHDADRIGLRAIGARLLEYRRIALHGTFRPAQLENASIMVTLSTDVTTFSRPIVFPGQICALSLGATTPMLVRDPAGGVTTHRAAHAGLAYDHRVLNGREAELFLSAVKGTLESLSAASAGFD